VIYDIFLIVNALISCGGGSQVKAELNGFEYIIGIGNYDYIHLLSGVDLPVKTQDYIHDFFEKNIGSNFIGFSMSYENIVNLQSKTQYFHPFPNYARHRNIILRKSASLFRKVVVGIQKRFKITRNWGMELYKGENWCSITYEFAKYLVERKKFIIHKFQGVICADEIYKQTLIMGSPFKDTVLDQTDFKPSTRKIDWDRGNPYIWRINDYNELINTKCLFARKFSSDTDKQIIDKIANCIIESSNHRSSLN